MIIEITVNGCISKMHPHFNKSGNVKLGVSMWSFSKLYGDDEFIITDNEKTISVVGSCGSFCKGCKTACYVAKSYRYPSVIKCHAENTIAFRNDINDAFRVLYNEIQRARQKPEIIRINQSGELESKEEFALWCFLARMFPNIKFYLYTKAYEFIDVTECPSNMFVNFSIWHEFGIDEFKNAKIGNQVSAFVLVDDEFTVEKYAENGINITGFCRAYDKNGKLNHGITCEKCKHCKRGNGEVVGCYEH